MACQSTRSQRASRHFLAGRDFDHLLLVQREAAHPQWTSLEILPVRVNPCLGRCLWSGRVSALACFVRNTRDSELARVGLGKQERGTGKTVLRLPDLEIAQSAVLNSHSWPDAQRGYRYAIAPL